LGAAARSPLPISLSRWRKKYNKQHHGSDDGPSVLQVSQVDKNERHAQEDCANPTGNDNDALAVHASRCDFCHTRGTKQEYRCIAVNAVIAAKATRVHPITPRNSKPIMQANNAKSSPLPGRGL